MTLTRLLPVWLVGPCLSLVGCGLFVPAPEGDVGGVGRQGTVGTDADLDGYPAGEDCDDGDATVNPAAPERCNGIDDNCNGVPDEDNAVVDGSTFYYDTDEDGYGDPSFATVACARPPGHVVDNTDCDDRRAAINPGALEVCDGVDNDCDGLLDDEDDSLGGAAADWFTDGDGDGYGDASSVEFACAQPAGTVPEGGDCDDTDPRVRPFADERCNGIDDDCDGDVDEDPVDSGTTYYPDGDGDGYGDASAGTEACSPRPGETTRGGDCDDGDPSINPGAAEVCNDGIDNDCDGGASGCTLEGDVALSVAGSFDMKLVGEDAYDYATRSVALVPDVSGDGIPDVAVGAVGDDRSAVNAGSVYLMRGNRIGTRDLSTADGRLVGESAGDEAGASVAGLGDVNGDGIGDLLIGAPGKDRSAADVGAAWLVLGPITSTRNLYTGDLVGFGESRQGYAGFAVSGGGDASDNGVVDLLVGAPGEDDSGAAYLLASDTTGRVSMRAQPTLYGEARGDLAGDAVSGGGDVNGDGVDDVVVGARQNAGAGAGSGAAYVVRGPITADLDLGTADLVLRGEAANDAAGSAVLLSGDLTGDGLQDVVVGATGQDSAGTGAGAVYIVEGGRTGTASLSRAAVKINGRASGDALGGALCLGGDVDGDGSADLLAGAQNHSSSRGAVFLFAGPLSGTVSASDATARIRGASASDRTYVCGGGHDVNFDGLDDVLVGGEGHAAGGTFAGAAWVLRPEGL